MILSFRPGDSIQFDYKNWEGKIEQRTVIFEGLDHGTNEFYPEPQWLLRGICHDRMATRSFAFANMLSAPSKL